CLFVPMIRLLAGSAASIQIAGSSAASSASCMGIVSTVAATAGVFGGADGGASPQAAREKTTAPPTPHRPTRFIYSPRETVFANAPKALRTLCLGSPDARDKIMMLAKRCILATHDA